MMPGDPVVGSTALRRPAITSPNYAAGAAGWSINADGSAEFNNATIRGTVTAATIIGALIESAAAGRRTTLDSGGDLKVYNASDAVLLWYANTANALWQYADTGSAAQGVLITSVAAAAGIDPFGNAYAAGIELHAGGLSLDNQGATPAAVAGASTLYSSGGGRLKFLSSTGVDAVLTRETVNVAQFAMGTQTLPTIISGPLNFRTNEGSQSSEYEIEIDGIITTPTSGSALVYTMGLFLDGVLWGASFSIGSAYLVVSKTFGYSIRFRAALTAAGAGAANVIADGQCSQLGGVNFGNTGTMATISSIGIGKAIDTTVDHTLQVFGNWQSGVASGHGVTTYRTRITRRD